MNVVSLSNLLDAGINPAAYYYAGRLLAGLHPMPDRIDAGTERALNYIIKEQQRMTNAAPKRGRKALTVAEPVGPDFVGATPADLAEQEAGARQLVAQHDARVRAVAEQLGYQLPAECTDPDLIQRDISANMRRSVEACLEVGRGLRVLKEACEHGQFMARLDVLGIDRTVATRFMQSATKFSNVASTHHLTAAIGSQTKLFEMLVLDDEQLEELELTGQTGELSLDDVATMSVKELRAALREEREQREATTRILQEKNAKLDELAAKNKRERRKSDPWPDEVAGLKDELSALGKVSDEALGKVLTLIDATEAAMEPLEEGSDAHQGYKTVVHHLGHTVDRLATLVAGLRREYDVRLAGYIALDLTNTLETPED